jgi:hypothetical protein
MVVDKSSLGGTGAAAEVNTSVSGTDPAFDQGTVGIYTLPLGSSEVSAVQEVQKIRSYGMTDDVGGVFRVWFMGQQSAEIAYNDDAATVKEALEAMSTVTEVSVSVVDVSESTVPPLSYAGREWLVTFTQQSGDLPSMLVSTGDDAHVIATGNSLTGSGATVEVEEVVAGTVPTTYDTPNTLSAGTVYYTRVSAYNVNGWSEAVVAPFGVAPALQVPSGPVDVRVNQVSDTQLGVSWKEPLSDGGSAVIKYVLQYDIDASFDGSMTTVVVNYVDGVAEYFSVISGLTVSTVYVVWVLVYNN